MTLFQLPTTAEWSVGGIRVPEWPNLNFLARAPAFHIFQLIRRRLAFVPSSILDAGISDCQYFYIRSQFPPYRRALDNARYLLNIRRKL